MAATKRPPAKPPAKAKTTKAPMKGAARPTPAAAKKPAAKRARS